MTLWDVEWFNEKVEQLRKKAWIPWARNIKKYSRRAILKTGYKNVFRKQVPKIRRWRYLQDIFTTLVDCQWRYTLGFLALELFGCWLAFALLYWLIAFVHGDLHEDHLPLRQAETGWNPCILNIHGFHSAFLYSYETQHTTGYGLRAVTEECPEAIFIFVMQCLIGQTLDGFAVSIVCAKLVLSKYATNTVQFSRNAVICHRDGKLCFMFRVGDIRKYPLAEVAVRAILARSERTQEGELLQSYQTELDLEADEGPSDLFLLWPMVVFHEINEDSPLYEFTAPKMRNEKIEIFVVFNATVESTGVSIEAKSSYISSEILWGHTFVPLVSFNNREDKYEIDWDKFDKTRLVDLQEFLEREKEEYGFDSEETKLLDDDNDDETSKNLIDFPQVITDDILLPLTGSGVGMLAPNMPTPPYRKSSAPAALGRPKYSRYSLLGSSGYDNIPETINECNESEASKYDNISESAVQPPGSIGSRGSRYDNLSDTIVMEGYDKRLGPGVAV